MCFIELKLKKYVIVVNNMLNTKTEIISYADLGQCENSEFYIKILAIKYNVKWLQLAISLLFRRKFIF